MHDKMISEGGVELYYFFMTTISLSEFYAVIAFVYNTVVVAGALKPVRLSCP